MNMTMQQPLSYPFYMGTSPRPFRPDLWSSIPFSYPYPRPLSPFIPSQQQNPFSKIPPPYSNTRYNHLKQLTNYPTRRPIHRSFDISKHPYRYSSHNNPIYSNTYRPTKTKSVSDLQTQISNPLPKAHSWHMMTNNHQSNLSVAYAKELNITPKINRKNLTPKIKKRIPHQKHFSSLSPKRNRPLKINHLKRSTQIPERGIIRISTLDEMPINNNNNNQTSSSNHDRLSTKGSISNSSQRRMISKGNKNRKINSNDQNDEEIHRNSDNESLSSNRSDLSLQQRLNGSLRNDPLITAAMEDFRQFRRTFNQNNSLIHSCRNLSHDSLYSDSTLQSSSSSSLPRSRNHSQSSFTSVERSEIRELIQNVKKKTTKSINRSLSSSPIRTSPILSEQSIARNSSSSSIPIIKTKKTLITEELDREFNKLRELNPNHEINYVTPSSISKRKKPIEIPLQTTPSVPKFDELLRQVQLRPINKIKPIQDELIDNNYENPLPSVPVPQCSPIPSEENKFQEPIHEYAMPIKKLEDKTLTQISHFQPIQNFNSKKLINNNPIEKQTSHSYSMFNSFHNDLTNLLPTTFQPNRIINNNHNQNDYATKIVNENIYTSDIDRYIPTSDINKNEDNTLQIHLDNHTILTDDYYADYQTKQNINSSSILNDLSYLFTRKHKQQNKLHNKKQRCSIM